jgi:hypothetical protein
MAEEFKVNTYIVAGVVGISAGGLLLVRSFRTFRSVSYWNTIGMTTVGALMIYGGVKAFQMKGSKDTEKATSAIKEDVTKVIAEVGETAEVAASESYEAEFTQSQRERLAKKGHALPDGSFPIRNKSDLKNAIKSWGLAKKSNKAKAKKFIKLRAKQLNSSELLPSTW